MFKKVPQSLPDRINHFLENIQPNQIMFCKRYKAEDIWNIAPGAVLDLRVAWPGLVEICKRLYSEDNGWFVGDVESLI